MFNLKSLLAASVASALFSSVLAGANVEIVKRTGEPAQPSCVDYTPFVYAGCFIDPSSVRGLLYDSQLDSQHMTIEKCVSFCKGNDYKYAGLEYYGECFCGASVNGAQVDESECSFPCTDDQTQICGGFDFISIYQDPTFAAVDSTTISDYKAMGCYSEGSSGRSLNWRQDSLSASSLTVDTCLAACKLGGYSYAGVEFAQECYCGVVLGNGTLPVDNGNCNMPCRGDDTKMCGGAGYLNLYAAMDMESQQPCGYDPPAGSSTTSPSKTSTTPLNTKSTSPLSTPTTSPTDKAPTTTPTNTPFTSPTTSKAPTVSVCTSTIISTPTSTCEYKCGNWCSKPLPDFTDNASCQTAVTSCAIQVASCLLNAGFPSSINCFNFNTWCNQISSYCGKTCPGPNCSFGSCKKSYPPVGASNPQYTATTTSLYPCQITTSAGKTSTVTSVPPVSTTSTCAIPVKSNICQQPHNPNKGYSSSAAVGAIELPCLTCNNLASDYQTNPFKLYSYADTTRCHSYGRNSNNNSPVQGCRDACNAQYASCINNFAEGCKSNNRRLSRRSELMVRSYGWSWGGSGGDSYNTATNKCKNQLTDCLKVNSNPTYYKRCGSFNNGWS